MADSSDSDSDSGQLPDVLRRRPSSEEEEDSAEEESAEEESAEEESADEDEDDDDEEEEDDDDDDDDDGGDDDDLNYNRRSSGRNTTPAASPRTTSRSQAAAAAAAAAAQKNAGAGAGRRRAVTGDKSIPGSRRGGAAPAPAPATVADQQAQKKGGGAVERKSSNATTPRGTGAAGGGRRAGNFVPATDDANSILEPGVTFVRWRESKESLDKGKVRATIIGYHMIDTNGEEHLAATGEASVQGDTHYTYETTEAFSTAYGKLVAHNRKEVFAYLENAMRQAGSADVPGTPVTTTPRGRSSKANADVRYVSYKLDRSHAANGSQSVRVILVDTAGRCTHVLQGASSSATASIVFRKVDGCPIAATFSDGADLAATRVWLKEILSGARNAPPSSPKPPAAPPSAGRGGATAGAAPGSPRSTGKRKTGGAGAAPPAPTPSPKRAKSDAGAGGPKGRQHGSAAAAPGAPRSGGAGMAGGGTSTAVGTGTGRGGAGAGSGSRRGVTAQSPAAAAAVAAATAEREAVQQAAACALGLQQSMAWMRESPEEMEMVMWRQHMAHVRALCEASKGTPEDAARLVYALRQLRALRCTITTLRATGAVSVMAALCAHASAPVADLARDLVARWRGEAVAHITQLFRSPAAPASWLAQRRADNAAIYQPLGFGGAAAADGGGGGGGRSRGGGSPAGGRGGRRRSLGGAGEAPVVVPGKGRKLCASCGTPIGSPTRVCPHCQNTIK
ncbi:TFIIS N-terminal domain-containing protein [Pseudoscourfieldia marina]